MASSRSSVGVVGQEGPDTFREREGNREEEGREEVQTKEEERENAEDAVGGKAGVGGIAHWTRDATEGERWETRPGTTADTHGTTNRRTSQTESKDWDSATDANGGMRQGESRSAKVGDRGAGSSRGKWGPMRRVLREWVVSAWLKRAGEGSQGLGLSFLPDFLAGRSWGTPRGDQAPAPAGAPGTGGASGAGGAAGGVSAEENRRREQWEQEWREALGRRRKGRGGDLNYMWTWPAQLVGSDWKSPYLDGKHIRPMEVLRYSRHVSRLVDSSSHTGWTVLLTRWAPKEGDPPVRGKHHPFVSSAVLTSQ